MAWIESHQEIGRHPKTKKLARRLGASIPATVGHLHLLWHWAMDFAEDGNLGDFESWELADAAMWEGDPDEFVDGLVTVGFIDQTEAGGELHDWHDYAGKLIQRRKEDAERKRLARQKADKTGTSPDDPGASAGRPQDVRTPSDVTVPNRTVPNPTGGNTPPNPPQRKRARKAAKAQEPTLTPEQLDRFERWYQHWPRKENRAKAEESWAAIDPDDALVDKMIATTQVYARSEKWREDGGKYIPHPSTWLNNARWNDEPPKVDPPKNITPFQNNGHRRPPGQRGYSADELLAMAREEANR